jgi:hypothetical protein
VPKNSAGLQMGVVGAQARPFGRRRRGKIAEEAAAMGGEESRIPVAAQQRPGNDRETNLS